MFAIISVIILTVALWILYHKLFRVVYFDAITAVFREFVICLVIAILIVLGISRAIGSVLPQEEVPDPEYFGEYHNTWNLYGPWCTITISGSETKDDYICIKGEAEESYEQYFQVELPSSDISENAISFYTSNSLGGSTITIVINAENHSLEVTQETADAEVPDVYTGQYVDAETWEIQHTEDQLYPLEETDTNQQEAPANTDMSETFSESPVEYFGDDGIWHIDEQWLSGAISTIYTSSTDNGGYAEFRLDNYDESTQIFTFSMYVENCDRTRSTEINGELSYDTASASWTTRFPEGILYVHLYTGFVELCQDFVFEESDFNISGVYYV